MPSDRIYVQVYCRFCFFSGYVLCRFDIAIIGVKCGHYGIVKCGETALFYHVTVRFSVRSDSHFNDNTVVFCHFLYRVPVFYILAQVFDYRFGIVFFQLFFFAYVFFPAFEHCLVFHLWHDFSAFSENNRLHEHYAYRFTVVGYCRYHFFRHQIQQFQRRRIECVECVLAYHSAGTAVFIYLDRQECYVFYAFFPLTGRVREH